jgi:putative ABC transport system permease protein
MGVATYFAIRTANQSLLHSLQATVDRVAGKASLQITAGESGFPESVLETTRATAGVADATGVVQMIRPTDLHDKAPVLIFGVDIEGEQRLRGLHIEGADALKLPGTIVLSSSFASEEGLIPGTGLPVFASQGRTELAILDVFQDERVGALFGGRVGLMYIRGAQDVFGRGANIDRVDVITSPDVSVDSVRQALKERLGTGLEIERPQAEHRRSGCTVTIRRASVNKSGRLSAPFSSSAMSIAVNQRWREIGILRALELSEEGAEDVPDRCSHNGAYRFGTGRDRRLRVGSGVQCTDWNPVQRAVVKHGCDHGSGPPRFSAMFALESIAIGIACTVISAWLPARAASKLNPVFALHNIETRRREAVVGWPRMVLGAAVVTIGLALIGFGSPQLGLFLQLSSVAFIFFGFILILPRLSGSIAGALRPLADRVFGSEGVLAVDSVILAPRRTSATVGALMAGLAFTFSTWGLIQSEKELVTRSFEREWNHDLQVWSPASMTEDFAAKVGQVPGIKHLNPLLTGASRYRGQIAGLHSWDMRLWFERPGRTLKEGDLEIARDLVPKGQGCLISNNFAARWRLGVGDVLILEAPASRLELPILGIVDYNAWFEGTVFLDRSLYKEYWRDDRINLLAIDLDPGANPDAVKSEVEQLESGGQPLVVQTSTEARRQSREVIAANIDQLFSFFYVQMLIATFVGVIGIINTLVISVWDRKREIGIIRALGGTRGQVRQMVLLEAGVICIIGLIAGIVKGVCDTYFMTHTVAAVFGGYTIPFYFPGGLMLLCVPVLIAVAIAAAWWPARVASRTNVVSAIGSE